MDYYENMKLGKRPPAIRFYSFGVANFLAAGDSVQSALITADTGINTTILETGNDYVKVKIDGGTAGATYQIEMVATTVNGEAVDMLVNMEVSA